MNIGLVNIYPWRPHGFHAGFLEYQCNLLGHSTYFLECNGSFDKCSAKLAGTNEYIHCVKCHLGSASKYNYNKISTISSKIPKIRLSEDETSKRLLSSVLAYYREEVNLEYFDNSRITKSIDQLRANYLKTYYSTLNLIDKMNLKALIVFNGRVDMTRAAIDAAKFAGINFITHDRPPMGHGIQINSNQDIIGLKDRAAMNAKFDDKPLTSYQAQLAGVEIAKRFTGKNLLEWRINNTSRKLSRWPTSTINQKILIVPSSIFERAGHEDWITPWKLASEGYDIFLKSMGIKNDQVVVRFHPQWIQNKGGVTGQSSHKHYKSWCKINSYHYIDSHEETSTLDLIDKCDILLVNSSTAAIEAGSLGKKIVNLGPSGYKGSRFFKSLETKESINKFKNFDNWISKEQIIRRTLRYVYTALARYPQYFDYVRGVSTTECVAYKGADPERLENLLKTGRLTANDEIVGSLNEENEVLDLISNQSWGNIMELYSKIQQTSKVRLNLSRSFPYGTIDNIRKNLKRGDI